MEHMVSVYMGTFLETSLSLLRGSQAQTLPSLSPGANGRKSWSDSELTYIDRQGTSIEGGMILGSDLAVASG